MAELAFTRVGVGPTLVLVHGLGLSRQSWEPVTPELAERFDVLAVDLPGFGDSAALPADVEPHPAALADRVASLLDNLGIDDPHVAGNSLGGWVALELAHRRSVASLTLLSPAGLWPGKTPLYDRVSLRMSRWLTRHATGALCRIARYRLGRIVLLGQTHGRPSRMSCDQAATAIRDLGRSVGFAGAFNATIKRRYISRGVISAPVTVAFGSRDLLLLPGKARRIDELPAGTERRTLARCGHVPMSDDPEAVCALIAARLPALANT